MTYLRECPFCGGTAELRDIQSASEDYPAGAKVECNDCQAKRFALGATQEHANEKAVEDWNERKGEDRLSAELAQARAVIALAIPCMEAMSAVLDEQGIGPANADILAQMRAILAKEPT